MAFRVHGPQQVYRAKTMACVLASDMAKAGDELILDNQGVVKATPTKWKGVVIVQAYHDIRHRNVTNK